MAQLTDDKFMDWFKEFITIVDNGLSTRQLSLIKTLLKELDPPVKSTPSVLKEPINIPFQSPFDGKQHPWVNPYGTIQYGTMGGNGSETVKSMNEDYTFTKISSEADFIKDTINTYYNPNEIK